MYQTLFPTIVRNTRKFIPNGDSDFACMARSFATTVDSRREVFGISEEDVEMLNRRVEEYRTALCLATRRDTRTPRTISLKDEARKLAEQVVRNVANFIRGDCSIPSSEKVLLKIKERPARPSRAKRILPRPMLVFRGRRDMVAAPDSGEQEHVIQFCTPYGKPSRARPRDATRLELFVELVDPHEQLPTHPAQLSGGRLWYLGSFSRNPIHVRFPMANRPMRVVYWARWADSRNKVGPFSATLNAGLEGSPWLNTAMRIEQARERVTVTELVKMPHLLEPPVEDIGGEHLLEDHTAMQQLNHAVNKLPSPEAA